MVVSSLCMRAFVYSGKKSKRGRQNTANMAVRFVDGRTINETNLEEVRARVAEFLS